MLDNNVSSMNIFENPEFECFTDEDEAWLNFFLLEYEVADSDSKRLAILALVRPIFTDEKKCELVRKILTNQVELTPVTTH